VYSGSLTKRLSPFAEEHVEALIPLLLHHLEKGDEATRSRARWHLADVLGEPRDPLPRYPTEEEESRDLDQWKALAEKYLAKRGCALRMPLPES